MVGSETSPGVRCPLILNLFQCSSNRPMPTWTPVFSSYNLRAASLERPAGSELRMKSQRMKPHLPGPDDLFGVKGDKSSILIGSCLGKSSRGGLISFDGETIEVIDPMSSTGLTIADGRLLRLFWGRNGFATPGELLVYDSTGIERYYRIDALNAPHDIAYDGKHYIVVSAGENSILWIGKNGEIERTSRFPGQPDSWHLNSLWLHGGDLLVAAFGRFNEHREWIQHKDKPCGIVFNHATGKDIITGLDRPHHPRMIDGTWVLCNSGARELLQVDCRTGAPLRRIHLGKWTRGLTFSDRYIFVGESARRHPLGGVEGAELGSIAILDRATWRLVGRVHLPFEEVYDLLLIPRSLVYGVRRAFNTAAAGESRQAHYPLTSLGLATVQPAASGGLLPREACLAGISVEIESFLAPDRVLMRPCRVENRGAYTFITDKPRPVVVTYRWLHKESMQYVRTLSMGTRLPADLPPGNSTSCMLRLRTPSTEGLYELQVSLFQKGRGFFTKIDPANAFRIDIWIHRTASATQ